MKLTKEKFLELLKRKKPRWGQISIQQQMYELYCMGYIEGFRDGYNSARYMGAEGKV
jgi:hypothetical protein